MVLHWDVGNYTSGRTWRGDRSCREGSGSLNLANIAMGDAAWDFAFSYPIKRNANVSNSYPTTPSILLAQRRLLIGFGSQRKLASDCTKSDFRTRLMDSSAFLPQMQHVLHLFFHSSHSDFQPEARLFPPSDHVFGSLSKQPPIIFWFGLVAHGTSPALGKNNIHRHQPHPWPASQCSGHWWKVPVGHGG